MTTAPKTGSILIEGRDGRRIVEGIPTNAKITYGPVQPGGKGYGQENALRIYTSQNNQLAVFLSVVSFRDLSLTVKVEKVQTEKSRLSERGAKGAKSEAHVKSTVEWEEA